MINNVGEKWDFIINDRRDYQDEKEKLTDAIKTINNLPVELKQKIAFKLDCQSYANLRLTSRVMSQALPSFASMLTGLAEGISGILRESYASLLEPILYEKSIREQLRNEKREDVLQSLQYACVSHCSSTLADVIWDEDIECIDENSHENLVIGTKYYPEALASNYVWNGEVLHGCSKEICHFTNRVAMPSGYQRVFLPHLYPGKSWVIFLHFSADKINKDTFNAIFKSFDKVFHEEVMERKMLVALFAFKLKNYCCANLPGGIDKSDAISFGQQFPKLLTTGKIVASVLAEKSIVKFID